MSGNRLSDRGTSGVCLACLFALVNVPPAALLAWLLAGPDQPASALLRTIAAVGLSALPSFVDHAQRWITHLGNVAAPLTGVVLADYLLVQHTRLDVPALFDPGGRYRYVNGVNAAALGAVAVAVAVYYAVPQSLLKVLWGLGVGAVAYLAFRRLQLLAGGRAAVPEVSGG